MGFIAIIRDLKVKKLLRQKARTRVEAAVVRSFTRGLQRIERRVVVEGFGGRPRLQTRSGTLVKAFRRVISVDGLNTTAVLRNPTIYAWLQEKSATITPKSSEYLWIPLDELRTPAGEFTGWDGLPATGLFTIRSRRNPDNKVLMSREGTGPPTAWAVLAKKVEVPGRMGLIGILREERPRIIAETRAEIRKAISFGR